MSARTTYLSSLAFGLLLACSVLLATRQACRESTARNDVGAQRAATDTEATADAAGLFRARLLAAVLRNTDVAGEAAGGSFALTVFQSLRAELVDVGSHADVEALLQSDVPQARALGLSLLVKEPRIARRRLPDYLCDNGRFPFLLSQSTDSFSSTISSVGQLAHEFLENQNVLRNCSDCFVPLASRSDIQRMDWRALSRDECAVVHSAAASVVSEQAADEALSWPSTTTSPSTLEPWQVVKAIGRVALREGSGEAANRLRDFLLKVATSATAPAQARLAAASALTRVGTAATLQVLQAHQRELDGLDVGAPGKTVLRTLRLRLRLDSEMRTLQKMARKQGVQLYAGRIADSLRRVEGEPFVLDTALNLLLYPFGHRQGAIRTQVEHTLMRQIDRAHRGFCSWDIESDLAFRLEAASYGATWNSALRSELERGGARRLAAGGSTRIVTATPQTPVLPPRVARVPGL